MKYKKGKEKQRKSDIKYRKREQGYIKQRELRVKYKKTQR